MSENIPPITEVIDMACKGYLPIKMKFGFQEDIYAFRGMRKNLRSIHYSNEDETAYIDFWLNKDGRLEYVEYIMDDLDELEVHILFDIKWTPELVRETYYNYGVLY